jgi:metallo-beta-lactamase family protein
MKIKFVGAIDGITGSCSWLKHIGSGTQWLVDCGMNQGVQAGFKNERPFVFTPTEITGVILTHAHIDHCGLIPKLYKEGFKGKVYCTEATAEISKIQLKSAVKHLSPKLYSDQDVDSIQWAPFDTDERFNWGKSIALVPNIKITPMRGSHMLGSSAIQLSWKVSESLWRNILFTGDVGNNTDDNTQYPMLKANHNAFPNSDYIMIESTYGARIREDQHKNLENRQAELWGVINETINSAKGKVLIPVFAAQRAQDVVLDCIVGLCNLSLIKDNGEPLKILMHSPSIAKLNKVYAQQLEKTFWTKSGQKNQYLNDLLKAILKPNELQDFISLLNTKTSSDGVLSAKAKFKGGVVQVSSDPNLSTDDFDIIISSSGMAEGGFIVKHLNRYQGDVRNTILITGYQAQGTKGALLCNEPESVAARIVNLSPYYSGHADQSILLDLVFTISGFPQQSDTTIFLNHGEYLAKDSFSGALQQRENEKNKEDRRLREVIIPDSESSWFDLNNDKFESFESPELLNKIKRLEKELAIIRQSD